jgi:hypothetical protein
MNGVVDQVARTLCRRFGDVAAQEPAEFDFMQENLPLLVRDSRPRAP